MSEDNEDGDEIILSELPDDELVLQMHDDLYDGLKRRNRRRESQSCLIGGGFPTRSLPRLWSRECELSESIFATEFCSFPKCCSPRMR